MVQVFGPEDAGYLLHLTGKLIGMQYFDEIARSFGVGRGRRSEFARVPARAVRSAGRCCRDQRDRSGAFEIRQTTWKLMADVSAIITRPAPASLAGLFEGLAAGCGRHIPVHLKPCGRRQAAVRLVDRLDDLARFACNPAGPHCAPRTWNRPRPCVGKPRARGSEIARAGA